MAAGLRRILEVLLAALLLLAGFAGLLALFGTVTAWLHPSLEPQQTKALRVGLQLAFIVVSIKGLLPQLLIAALLRPLIAGALASWRDRPVVAGIVLWLASACAYAVVGPLLLTREVLGLPALQHATLLQHLGTLVSTSTGVAAALGTARFLLRRGERAAPR